MSRQHKQDLAYVLTCVAIIFAALILMALAGGEDHANAVREQESVHVSR